MISFLDKKFEKYKEDEQPEIFEIIDNVENGEEPVVEVNEEKVDEKEKPKKEKPTHTYLFKRDDGRGNIHEVVVEATSQARAIQKVQDDNLIIWDDRVFGPTRLDEYSKPLSKKSKVVPADKNKYFQDYKRSSYYEWSQK